MLLTKVLLSKWNQGSPSTSKYAHYNTPHSTNQWSHSIPSTSDAISDAPPLPLILAPSAIFSHQQQCHRHHQKHWVNIMKLMKLPV